MDGLNSLGFVHGIYGSPFSSSLPLTGLILTLTAIVQPLSGLILPLPGLILPLKGLILPLTLGGFTQPL